MIRPGGTELTERALQLAGILPGSTVFDIGCGSGETVRELRKKGYRASGIDLIAQNTDTDIRQADAASMPYGDGTADGLLFECSFSGMEGPEKVLAEASRVLKENGKLIVADMIARREEGCFHGYLGRLETEEHLKERLLRNGFLLQAEERHDAEANVFFGNMLLEKGTEETERLLGGCLPAIRRTSPGYVILILGKGALPDTGKKTAMQTSGKKPVQTGEEYPAGRVFMKLKAQAEYARKNSAYYSRTLPETVRKPEDLPFTFPSVLQARPEDFLCVSQTKVKRTVTLGTSGTTGDRKRIYFTEKDLESTVCYFAEGMSPMVKAGETAGILFPGEGENGLPDLIAMALKRLGVVAEVFHGGLQPKQDGAGDGSRKNTGGRKDASAEIRAKVSFCRGKDFLTGMPADLFRLCRMAPELRPLAVLLSGDDVPDQLRRTLETVWGCEVFTHYGMTEAGFGLAVECSAHRGMHIRTEDLYVETVDPETGTLLPAGREGELVITTLDREAMPLMRYRTGDLGILEENVPCSCGRKTPRIRKVCGRKEASCGYPSIHEISEVLYGLPDVTAFDARRCGENGERKIRIRLECDAGADPSAIKKHLETSFRGTSFDVIRTEEIISTVSKKLLL